MNYLSRFRSNWIKRWKESDSFEKIVGGLYALLVLVTVLFLSEEEFKKFARYFAIDRSKRFDDLTFPGDEERIRTRLGEEGAMIAFADPVPIGPFGKAVAGIVLPAHMSVGIPVDEAPVALAKSDGSITFSAGDRQFVYDRYGARRAGVPDEPSDRPDHPAGDPIRK